MAQLPTHAQIVIIGGGIIGCSLAYHLTKLGRKDVLLLERKKLTSGTTWHAAGLVRAMLYTANLTKLAKYTVDLYKTLERETGQATGYKQNGSLSIATNEERWDELRRGASMARAFGVPAEPVTPKRVQELWPLMNTADLIGAIHFPEDGSTNPADTTMAFAKGARAGGARLIEDCKVTGVRTKNGRALGVTTEAGDVGAEIVVNCAGLWGREVGKMAGVDVPLHACEHFYIVTESMNVPSTLPVMRDMDACAYYKEDAGKLLIGAFEPKAKPWAVNGIPEDFCFTELPEDFDHFEPVLQGAIHRVPRLAETGIRKFFNGPESFTTDQRYLLGPSLELENFYVAAGFNSVGIQSAGGVGMALAHWIAEGHPPFDLWDVDSRRSMPHQNNKTFLIDRVSEALGLLYAMHWPYRQFETARGVRKTPLYERLKSHNACFGEVAGWERANWFAPEGVEPKYQYSFKRQNWFDYCAQECRATRAAVGLFDQSTFAKFTVRGPDAESVLQRICANDIGGAPGRAVYTQWLNERGGIEADLTVTRLADDAYMVVTAAAAARRDLLWLKKHIPSDARASVEDITAAYAVLGVMGPNSRALLQKLTTADLTNATFPFGASKEIEIGYARLRASRISYMGELGWELYVPAEFAVGVFDRILEQGSAHGLKLCGMHAMDSLRIEKAYRHWGHDIGEEDTPIEAGLGFVVAYDKKIPFIGRDALLKQKTQGKLTKRLLQFALEDPEPLLYHNEPIYRDGRLVGYSSSAAYGHTLGRAIALGYVNAPEGVDQAYVDAGKFEIEVACKRYPAHASLRPLYDPRSERMRI
ncbi:MAG TPA: FAD-dependent oxidoreductase [Candidatus Acidoferrum sp.]|nr:FAD-dependent oxidoreductase [Candidatus Acidoferrum sp.]